MKTWWRAMVAYPPTWIAVVVLVLAGWLFMTLAEPPALFAVLAVVALVLALAAWPFTMSATGTLARLQFEVVRREAVDPEELRSLREELDELDDPRPIRQLAAIEQKRNNLARVLSQRLDAGELTHARYMSTAQDVYRATLANLHEIAVAMRSVSTIDEEYIRQRLSELESAVDGIARRERESLENRLGLQDAQEAKVAALLAQNESAMTALDRTAAALADAPIGRTPEDAEAAMDALEELAQRAGKYATG